MIIVIFLRFRHQMVSNKIDRTTKVFVVHNKGGYKIYHDHRLSPICLKGSRVLFNLPSSPPSLGPKDGSPRPIEMM